MVLSGLGRGENGDLRLYLFFKLYRVSVWEDKKVGGDGCTTM